MRILIYFSHQLPGITDDLENAGFRVFEALAFSEVFYLAEQHPSAHIVIDSTVEDAAAQEVAQHHPTMRLQGTATVADIVWELSAPWAFRAWKGVVAKDLNSLYEPGRRSGAWRKMRLNKGQEFVIGGYTLGAKYFDAVIFGYYEAGKLLYAGRTRNGFTPIFASTCRSVSAGWRFRTAHLQTSRKRGRAAGAWV
jgi:ATP-dependent DNA ligase